MDSWRTILSWEVLSPELQEKFHEGQEVSAQDLVEIFQAGYPQGDPNTRFKANWTGVWDAYEYAGAKAVTINQGRGFEQALVVHGPEGGMFFYFPPFQLTAIPTDTVMLLFQAHNAFYLQGL